MNMLIVYYKSVLFQVKLRQFVMYQKFCIDSHLLWVYFFPSLEGHALCQQGNASWR